MSIKNLFSKRSKIMILSGSSVVRYPSILNHLIYAKRFGYQYRFDVIPEIGIDNIYLHKLAIIRRSLPDCDWLFWLDDDAFFRKLDVPLIDLVDVEMRDNDLIFCKSPINNGNWTHLSSGNFFIRNCRQSFWLLDRCLTTPMSVAKEWWNTDKYGMFTGGDQDLLVYHIENESAIKKRCALLPYERFNTRPFHFDVSDSHFLVHFTYRPEMSKQDQMKEFSRRFELHASLVEAKYLSGYEQYARQLES